MAPSRQEEEEAPKPRRHHHPSPWGSFFLHHKPYQAQPQYLLAMKDMARVRKEQVRKTILDAIASSSLAPKLELVDTLQRIGVGYHYEEEIGELLRDVLLRFKEEVGDLRVTALRFYLLRKHGYNVSSDVFLKFVDEQGDFAVGNDAKSLLALYDAAHLRTHGEDILDRAIVFSRSHLSSMMKDLEPDLAEQVRSTLETPSFRRVERVEAARYISAYKKEATHYDEAILELAKLDFNILQALYCDELRDLTVWWREFQSETDLEFARDRVVEMHLWMAGVFYEPQFSCSRVMMTKLVKIISLFDDFYDNYSTTQESYMFTKALEMWDEEEVEHLPTHLKALYINTLKTTDDIIRELKHQKNRHAERVRNLMIHMARCYHAEVTWRDQHYVPADVEEHLHISTRSSACMQITGLAFVMLGDDVTTSDDLEWAIDYPKIVTGVCIVGRISNDIVSHEREQASEHVASTVQTCMKEHGVGAEEAGEKLRARMEEAWMDIADEWLAAAQGRRRQLLERTMNLGRTMDFMYKRVDAYTLSSALQHAVDSIYVNPV